MEDNNTSTTSSSSKKMNPMMIIIGVVVLLAVVGGAFALMGNKGTSTEDAVMEEETGQMEQTVPQGSSDTTVPQGSSATDSMTAQEFTVEGGNFFFKPNELRVKKGEPVTITFNNTEGFHDFVIDEISGAKTQRIQTGTSETITFTPTEAGSFEFYCSVGSHRQMGMVGTLIVEE